MIRMPIMLDAKITVFSNQAPFRMIITMDGRMSFVSLLISHLMAVLDFIEDLLLR